MGIFEHAGLVIEARLGRTMRTRIRATDASGDPSDPFSPPYALNRVRECRLTLPVVASALFLAVLGSCDSGPVVEPEPSLQIVPDSVTLTHIGERFAFTVRGGGPGADAVRWSSRDTTVFVVDAEGTVTARGNGSAGLLVEWGRQWSQAPVRVEQAAVTLETVGDGQEAVVGIPLWRPVAVRLLDAGGTPVSVATTVRFDASAHGGAADPAEALSDSAGMAWTEWTLGACRAPRRWSRRWPGVSARRSRRLRCRTWGYARGRRRWPRSW